jgi:hypothetical protein
MSLLTLIQDVCKQVALPAPTAVMSSTNSTVLEMLVMANSVGDELTRRYFWQELTREANFQSTGTIDMGYLSGSIATDFAYWVDQTFWDRDLRQNIIGPVSMQEWQSDQSFAVVGPPYKFIVIADKLLVGPTALAAAHTMVFNYISKNWCQSATGTGQSAFAADTDVMLIPQELFKLSLLWRWKQAKGLAYAEDMESAEEQIDRYTGQNAGRRVLFIGGSGIYYLAENVPMGDWPQVPP